MLISGEFVLRLRRRGLPASLRDPRPTAHRGYGDASRRGKRGVKVVRGLLIPNVTPKVLQTLAYDNDDKARKIVATQAGRQVRESSSGR